MPHSVGYYRQLAGRAVVLLPTMYVLALGGTYNGILRADLRQVSLGILTLVVGSWLLVGWRVPGPLFVEPLGPALAIWAAAFAVSVVHNPSGRVYIGLWYAGLYAATWFTLGDLRRRGLPGPWITDAALLAMVPLMLLAVIQVLPWWVGWLSLRGVSVAFAPARPPSTLGNPNTLGTALAVLIPFGVVRAVQAPARPDRVLARGWLALALGVLYLTYSRGAWLAAGSGVTVLGALALNRRRANRGLRGKLWSTRRTQTAWMLGGLAVAILSAALLAVSLSAFNTPRRETHSRLAFFEIAWREFTDHPITGTGPFTFGLSLSAQHSIPPDQPHAHAHNLILNVAAEMGLPGLIALLLTCALIIRSFRQTLCDDSGIDSRSWTHTAACAAALVAFGVHSLVDLTLLVPAVMLLLLAILAAGPVPIPAQSRPGFHARWKKRLIQLVPVALWGAVLISGWWSARIYATYMHGQQLVARGEYRRGADVLRTALRERPDLALVHAQYGYACGLAVYAGDGFCLSAGIQAYERALKLEPPQAVWWANLAALYQQAQQPADALRAMQQAVHYAPDDPDLWLNLGIFYEAQGRIKLANDAYRRVLELAPVWGQAAFWRTTPLRRDALAAHPVEPTPYQRAVSLWQAGQPYTALAVLEQTIAHDPMQPGPYTQIARLYITFGDPARAQDYLDAARVLVHADHDLAWIYVVEAEAARARGDHQQEETRREMARQALWPNSTGYPLVYDQDIAHFQFLHLAVPGALLPPLIVLGPDPVLTDLLR